MTSSELEVRISAIVTQPVEWSYRKVLRNRRLATLLGGRLVSSLGDGMLISALPLLTLQVRGQANPAVAIALVEAAPYAVALVLSAAIGVGRISLPVRSLLIVDCVLRAALFGMLAVLAFTGTLSLWALIVSLLLGSVVRLAAASGARVVATGMVAPAGRFAVNGLLGTGTNLATLVLGPVLGGLLATLGAPGLPLAIDAVSFGALLIVVLYVVPRRRVAADDRIVSVSGARVIRGSGILTRLVLVVFLFNLLYMPVEVALPLLVRGPLHGSGAALGAIWTAFGIGALLGSMATGYLRRLPRQAAVLGIIAAWASVVALLALVPSTIFAIAVFALGGVVYAPFTPIVYTVVQSLVRPDEQHPVLTLWRASTAVSAPVGLSLSGPMLGALGARTGLLISAA
ncbi:MAG: MFS transporter, partial [Sciscionella sp.]